MQGNPMMQNVHGCPMCGGGTVMMSVMGVISILVVAALFLSIAALVKYLRSKPACR